MFLSVLIEHFFIKSVVFYLYSIIKAIFQLFFWVCASDTEPKLFKCTHSKAKSNVTQIM